jgi:hypothetical protein
MQGGNIRQLLVGKDPAIAFSQLGEGRAGNGHGGLLAIQQENCIDTVTMARGDGWVKVNKMNFDRRF